MSDPLSKPGEVYPNLAVDLQHVMVVRGQTTILNDVSWQLPAGACGAILGPNGSGKSTTARVILGQIWPTTGRVTVLGKPFGETDLNALRQDIRLVQSSGGVEIEPKETVENVVLTGYFGTVGLYKPVTKQMRDDAGELVASVGLASRHQAAFGTLSSGERMRCLLARALVVSPRLLILDEPTAGLDVLAREQLLATVHRLMRESANPPALLTITHHVEELLPETSAVLLLKEGRVAAAGTAGEVLTREHLSAAYGVAVDVTRRDGRYWLHVAAGAWERL